MRLQRLTLLVLISLVVGAASLDAQIGGTAGSFARMGYHARGMAMGNALTAVNIGDIHTYYNPALSPFAKERTASASFSMLSLDRYFNFLDYIQSAKPTAGISGGLINSGVRRIDGRDDDGQHTEDYSTSENQFFLSFGNRFDDRISLGITIKLYYYKLFEEVSSTTVGFDAGALILLSEDFTLGLMVQDIGSKYKWDTRPIYGESGLPTTNNFPMLYRGGLCYRLPSEYGIVALDLEISSEKTTILRLGTEFRVHEFVQLRGGLDRWDLRDNTTGTKPSLGFGLRKPFEGWTPAIDYAYVFEPFAPSGIHVVTVSIRF